MITHIETVRYGLHRRFDRRHEDKGDEIVAGELQGSGGSEAV